MTILPTATRDRAAPQMLAEEGGHRGVDRKVWSGIIYVQRQKRC